MPGKVLAKIKGVPLIELLLKRLEQSKSIDHIVVATSVDPRNLPLVDLVRSLGFACEQGSENDVLDRYYQAAKKHAANVVVRITGDCPLVDPKLVDLCIDEFIKSKVDYLSNTNPPTYPDGLDIEVMTFDALAQAHRQATTPFDREHVTPYLRNGNQFRRKSITGTEDYSNLRWTVDDPEDFEVIKNVFESLGVDRLFGWEEVLELSKQKPELFSANIQTKRDEGATQSTGKTLEEGQASYPRRKHAAVQTTRDVPAGPMASLFQQIQRMPRMGSRWTRVHRYVHHGYRNQYPRIRTP